MATERPNLHRLLRRMAWVCALLLLLVFALLGLAHRWVSGEEFRLRVQKEAQAVLGVPVRVGGLGVTVFPWPGIALDDVELRTRQSVKVARVELRPGWLSLLWGRVTIASLTVREAVLPQQGIEAVLASLQRMRQRDQGDKDGSGWQFFPHRTVLDRVSWVDSRGKAVTIQADLRFGNEIGPEQLEMQVVQGRLQGTRMSLVRRGDLIWDVDVEVADGEIRGELSLKLAENQEAHVLKGRLVSRNIEVSKLMAQEPTEASRLSQPLRGRLDAETHLEARWRQPSSLLDALQSQSRFTVRRAVLHGVDLVKAVQTAGVSRGGDTPLDTLSGQVSTRGKAIELQSLVAKSGVLAATGQISVSPKQELSGKLNADLAGAVGVPLVVGGTLDDPEVSLSAGAKIGAALGTVLMPGVGTGAGASLGGKLGNLLGK